jgi:hypothetical protein
MIVLLQMHMFGLTTKFNFFGMVIKKIDQTELNYYSPGYKRNDVLS